MMVLCKFCKHFVPSKHNEMEYSRCRRTAHTEISLVDGSSVVSMNFCDLERKDHNGNCGPSGTFFEPVDETTQRVGS